jgi:hypothetical protein
MGKRKTKSFLLFLREKGEKRLLIGAQEYFNWVQGNHSVVGLATSLRGLGF